MEYQTTDLNTVKGGNTAIFTILDKIIKDGHINLVRQKIAVENLAEQIKKVEHRCNKRYLRRLIRNTKLLGQLKGFFNNKSCLNSGIQQRQFLQQQMKIHTIDEESNEAIKPIISSRFKFHFINEKKLSIPRYAA